MNKIILRSFISALAILASTYPLFAQEAALRDERKVKKVKFVPLPVIGANPTSGFLFGLAPGAYWSMGERVLRVMHSGNHMMHTKQKGKPLLKRIDILQKYTAGYGTMDDAQLDKLMTDIQSLQEKTDKLIIKYYGKIKKESGVKAASQFYELEGYFLSVIWGTILENIPFIGELDEKW